MDTTQATLLEVQKRVDNLLERFVADSHPKFQRAYRHVLRAPAKRLRAALAYATGDIFSTPRETIDDFALAIELLHTATLIFDDLPGQDDADWRRGRETLHKVFGEAEAQMAGLALIINAEQLVTGADTRHTLNGNLVQYVNESIGQRGLCLGQLQDLQTFNQTKTVPYDAALLDTISELKTGRMIEVSVIGSAMIAEQPEPILRSLEAYTHHTSLAFQVKDDLLDYTGDKATIGKTVNLDAKNQKPNYVSVLGLEATQAKLAQHIVKAKEAVRELPPTLDTHAYIDLVDFVAARNH